MRINGEFVIREIAGDHILIPMGETAMRTNGLISLNEIGVLIWREIEKGSAEDAILQKIVESYDADEETARTDMCLFIKKLEESGLVVQR